MSAATRRRIVSIGECMVELSSAGEGLYRKGFAGDTFNTAWYLRRGLGEGWDVAYHTALGTDTTSDEMLAFFTEAGLATDLVRRIPERMPGLYMIHLDGAERSFSYWRDSAAAKLLAADPAQLDAAAASGDAFYFSGITLAILSPDDRQRLLDMLGAARAAGKLVAFDPNIRPRLWPEPDVMRAAMEAGAAVASLCLPSFPDEVAAFGDASPEATARRYLACGTGEVVVKDGSDPTLVATEGGFETVAARKVADVIDTTGAGDSFNAGYLAARLDGAEPRQAAERGHELAGEVVRHYGALIR
ncbi:sugar kinase [Aurantimonas coralicida]|uniref:sugar kinase n=1 Tax=Aurantimonas coralicida TaxID=182270 RepID=UPI001D19791D|nr:sugar kinase [Aurantimonas coralicida]MCC4298903.1 sugar kinase [Aurantimonas coralicida]